MAGRLYDQLSNYHRFGAGVGEWPHRALCLIFSEQDNIDRDSGYIGLCSSFRGDRMYSIQTLRTDLPYKRSSTRQARIIPLSRVAHAPDLQNVHALWLHSHGFLGTTTLPWRGLPRIQIGQDVSLPSGLFLETSRNGRRSG